MDTPPDDGCMHRIAPDTVRMVRLLPATVDQVWDFLVDPDKRALWLAGGPLEPRLGGAVELQFRHADLSPHPCDVPDKYRGLEHGHVLRGRITTFDPPHVLAFTWGDGPSPSEVRFELTAQDGRTRLVLTHARLADDAERGSVSGGWHAHCDILEDQLHHRVPEAFWTRHAVIEAMYRQREQNG